jgi:hypothetical protein
MRTTPDIEHTYGHVAPSGAVTSGTGFTVTKTATGTYVVRVQRSKALLGVNAVGDYGTPAQTGVGYADSSSVTIYTGNAAGSLVDQNFYFDVAFRRAM